MLGPEVILELLDGYGQTSILPIFREWIGTSYQGLGKQRLSGAVAAAMTNVMTQSARAARLPRGEATILGAAARVRPKTIAALELECQAQKIADAALGISSLLRKGFLFLRWPKSGPRIDLAPHRYGRNRAFELLMLEDGPYAASTAAFNQTLAVIPPERIRRVLLADPTRLIGALLGLVKLVERRKIKLKRDHSISDAHLDLIVETLALDEQTLHRHCFMEFALDAAIVSVGPESQLRRGAQYAALARDDLATSIARLYEIWTTTCIWPDDLPHQGAFYDFSSGPPDEPFPARLLMGSVLRRFADTSWFDLEAVVEEALTANPKILYGERRGYYGGYQVGIRHAEDLATQRAALRCVIGRGFYRLGLVDLGELTAQPYAFGRPTERWDHWEKFASLDPKKVDSRPRWTPTPCQLAVRLTPLGERLLCGRGSGPSAQVGAALTVSPDFEVFAPRDRTPPEVILRLEMFAVAHGGAPDDPVRRFRLEKPRLLDALRSGLALDVLTETLLRHSGRPLPENVARTLSDWAGAYGKLRLYTDYDLVEASDDHERAAVLAALPQANFVGQRFALVLPNAAMASKQHPKIIDYNARPTRCLTLDASGDVRVDAEKADLITLDGLARFSEPGQKPNQRRITRAAVAASRDSADQIIDVLERVAERVPKGLAFAIRGWSGELTAVPSETLTLVDLGRHLGGLLERPELLPYISGTLEGRFAVLKPAAIAGFLNALADLGIGLGGAIPREAVPGPPGP